MGEEEQDKGSGSGMIIIAVIGGVIAGALITFLVMRARQKQYTMGLPNIPYPAIPVQQPVEVQAPEPVVHNSEHLIVRKDKKGRIVEFIGSREVHGG